MRSAKPVMSRAASARRGFSIFTSAAAGHASQAASIDQPAPPRMVRRREARVMAPMRGHVRSTAAAADGTEHGARLDVAGEILGQPPRRLELPRRERLLRLIREVRRLRPVALPERNVEPAARRLAHHHDLGRGLAALAPPRVVLALLGVAHVAQRRRAASLPGSPPPSTGHERSPRPTRKRSP